MSDYDPYVHQHMGPGPEHEQTWDPVTQQTLGDAWRNTEGYFGNYHDIDGIARMDPREMDDRATQCNPAQSGGGSRRGRRRAAPVSPYVEDLGEIAELDLLLFDDL